MITEYLHWSQKNKYLQLIKDFLNSKIDAEEFDKEFYKMLRVIKKNIVYYLVIMKSSNLLNQIQCLWNWINGFQKFIFVAMSFILPLTPVTPLTKIEKKCHLQKQKNNFGMLLRIYFQKFKTIFRFKCF